MMKMRMEAQNLIAALVLRAGLNDGNENGGLKSHCSLGASGFV
jgi:hypothetical protein